MATVEKPQPMDVDTKKVEEKVEEKPELVNLFFCRVIIQSKPIFVCAGESRDFPSGSLGALTHYFSDGQIPSPEFLYLLRKHRN